MKKTAIEVVRRFLWDLQRRRAIKRELRTRFGMQPPIFSAKRPSLIERLKQTGTFK